MGSIRLIEEAENFFPKKVMLERKSLIKKSRYLKLSSIPKFITKLTARNKRLTVSLSVLCNWMPIIKSVMVLLNKSNKNQNVDSAIYETKIVINLIRGMYYGNSEFKEFIEKYPNAEVD